MFFELFIDKPTYSPDSFDCLSYMMILNFGADNSVKMRFLIVFLYGIYIC